MRLFSSLRFKFGRVGTQGEELNLVLSLLIELSFKVGRVGTLGEDRWGVKFEFGFKFEIEFKFQSW